MRVPGTARSASLSVTVISIPASNRAIRYVCPGADDDEHLLARTPRRLPSANLSDDPVRRARPRMSFWVVSDLNSAELGEVASALQVS
jgi:hypothetical protein